MMSLTIVLEFFNTALRMFLSSAAIVFLFPAVVSALVFFFFSFNIPDLQNGLLFFHRQYSGLHDGLSILMTSADFTGETQGSN